jgi:hypothetical protein
MGSALQKVRSAEGLVLDGLNNYTHLLPLLHTTTTTTSDSEFSRRVWLGGLAASKYETTWVCLV